MDVINVLLTNEQTLQQEEALRKMLEEAFQKKGAGNL